MTFPLRIFVDSDVVISSLLSQKGAAYFLIKTGGLQLFVSNISVKELGIVAERLNIKKGKLTQTMRKNFKVIGLGEDLNRIKSTYGDYVTDPNDAHIVAGAITSKSRFIVSYNLKHFKVDKIKQNFNIQILKPATFLQYLRSVA